MNDPTPAVPSDDPTVELSSEQIAKICGIELDVESSDRDASLRTGISDSGYPKVRPGLTDEVLVHYLRSRPELVTHWLRYSGSKRTTSGWHLLDDGDHWTVTRLLPRRSGEHYGSLRQACAHFILAELDFWADVVGESPSNGPQAG